jgi:hypothetical protein
MKQIFVILSIIILFGCDKGADSSFATGPNAGGGAGVGGSLARFTVVGNYLYSVDKENLKVFNVTNPAQPVFTRTVPVGFEIETIYPFKDKLFIGSTSVVHIFSITDPSNPQKLSVAISPNVIRRCDPVVAKDTVAYATLRTNGACGGTQSILAVYDIKDVLNPIQRNAIPVSEPYGLGYADNTLYVCDRNGLLVFDITQAYNPVFRRTINGIQPMDVIPYGNILIVWTNVGMSLYDITNRQNPVFITQIN